MGREDTQSGRMLTCVQLQSRSCHKPSQTGFLITGLAWSSSERHMGFAQHLHTHDHCRQGRCMLLLLVHSKTSGQLIAKAKGWHGLTSQQSAAGIQIQRSFALAPYLVNVSAHAQRVVADLERPILKAPHAPHISRWDFLKSW